MGQGDRSVGRQYGYAVGQEGLRVVLDLRMGEVGGDSRGGGRKYQIGGGHVVDCALFLGESEHGAESTSPDTLLREV